MIFEIIREARAQHGPDATFSINALERAARFRAATGPRASLVLRAWGGGIRGSRPGSINWHVERVQAAAHLVKVDRAVRLRSGS